MPINGGKIYVMESLIVFKKQEKIAGKIGAVGVSGMVPTVILLDKKDKVLRNSIQ